MPGAKPNLELTTTEKRALLFYREHFTQFHAPPTFRVLAAHLGVHPGAAHYVVQGLKRKGFLEERPITQMRLVPNAKARKVSE